MLRAIGFFKGIFQNFSSAEPAIRDIGDCVMGCGPITGVDGGRPEFRLCDSSNGHRLRIRGCCIIAKDVQIERECAIRMIDTCDRGISQIDLSRCDRRLIGVIVPVDQSNKFNERCSRSELGVIERCAVHHPISDGRFVGGPIVGDRTVGQKSVVIGAATSRISNCCASGEQASRRKLFKVSQKI